MDSFLRCRISPGQFSNELAISGGGFSLFAARELVELEQEPSRGHAVEGWLRVKVIERGKEKALVRLPNEALEIGYFITVDVDQLKARRKRRQTQS